MTVEGLLKNGFGAVATPEPQREITGVYIGDLLSWVMGPCRRCLHNSGGECGNTRGRLQNGGGKGR